MKKLFFALISLSFYTASAQTSAYINGISSAAYASGNLIQFQSNAEPQVTVEVWVKRDTIITSFGSSFTQTIIDYNDQNLGDPHNILNISVVDDSIKASYGQVKAMCYYPADTEWHHIALVCDTTLDTAIAPVLDSITLYLDGVKQSSNTGVKVFASIGPAVQILSIGTYYTITWGYEYSWKGHISNVVVYDSAMYAGNFVPNCAYDTTQFVNGTVTEPVDFLITLNDNDTGYYDIAHAGGDGKLNEVNILYTYQTAPCLPTTSVSSAMIDDIKVYPNPVEDVLNIRGSTTIEKVEIINIFGQIVLTSRYNVIDLSTLHKGLYILKINNNFMKRIIKE